MQQCASRPKKPPQDTVRTNDTTATNGGAAGTLRTDPRSGSFVGNTPTWDFSGASEEAQSVGQLGRGSWDGGTVRTHRLMLNDPPQVLLLSASLETISKELLLLGVSVHGSPWCLKRGVVDRPVTGQDHVAFFSSLLRCGCV